MNGWNLTYHLFDYNLDFFEVGTIDAPEWKIADPQVRIAERAVAAIAGLWGNHGYEAAYAITYLDSDGEQLDGGNEYTLRLSPTPPVGAFWSVTMYSIPDFYLVANEIDRYSLGDRTPGIVFDDDGGLTITMSHAKPSDSTGGCELAPGARCAVPSDPAHVRPRSRSVRRHLRAARDRTLLVGVSVAQ